MFAGLQKIIKFKDDQLLEMTKLQFEYAYDGINFIYKKSDDEKTKKMESLLNEARIVMDLLLELMQEAGGYVQKEWC